MLYRNIVFCRGASYLRDICIITNKYPNPLEPNVLVFVQQLVWEMADQGVNCTVICPVPVNVNPKYLKFPYKTTERTDNGSTINVFFPKYIGFGQSDMLGYNPARLTTHNFEKAVSKVIGNMNSKPSAVYGHFVTPAGITAARIGKKYNIPSFMAHGEATPNTINHFGVEGVRKELTTIDGVIAVSTHNKEMLTSLNVVEEKKIVVFPNGYRDERFFPRDRIESRRKFNLPEDKFIVSFVGSFDHRKGINRVMESVNKLDDVYVICAGKGHLQPKGEKCLYSGIVNNEELPYFYSASDAFVLPTLNEGCCNAIIEAMACGLPIVSSNKRFNDDILDNNCSLRIDPLAINEIGAAIRDLFKEHELRRTLGNGSIAKAKTLTLKKRAQNIVRFIENKINTTILD
jgi:glycosyltransferase involved in cell wall biosynthesis